MSEYITKEDALEAIGKAYGDVAEAEDNVRAIPAADVVEVKHGWWIVDRMCGNDVMSGEKMVICSVCNKGIFWGKQNYCPHCGAKMDAFAKDTDVPDKNVGKIDRVENGRV